MLGAPLSAHDHLICNIPSFMLHDNQEPTWVVWQGSLEHRGRAIAVGFADLNNFRVNFDQVSNVLIDHSGCETMSRFADAMKGRQLYCLSTRGGFGIASFPKKSSRSGGMAMASDMRMGGARLIGVAAVLGTGLLLASGVARADDRYTFTLTPLSGRGANASGTFTLGVIPNTSIALFTSVNVNLYSDGIYYTIDRVIFGSNVQNNSIGAVFTGSGSSLGIYGTPTVTHREISGTVNTTYATNEDYFGPSLFDAVLSSDSNSGGGASGGAPAPEVNAALSLAIAGATVAVLRRKRGGRSGPAAA